VIYFNAVKDFFSVKKSCDISFFDLNQSDLVQRVKIIYKNQCHADLKNVNLEISTTRFGHFVKDSLKMNIHPLLLIDPKELPKSLIELRDSSNLQSWVESYFKIEIKDKSAFANAATFFFEIWQEPEMFERVQNLLLAKQLVDRESFQSEWNWDKLNQEFIKNSADIKALKTVIKASEVVAKKSQGIWAQFTSWISGSPMQRLAKMESAIGELDYKPLAKSSKSPGVAKRQLLNMLRVLNLSFYGCSIGVLPYHLNNSRDATLCLATIVTTYKVLECVNRYFKPDFDLLVKENELSTRREDALLNYLGKERGEKTATYYEGQRIRSHRECTQIRSSYFYDINLPKKYVFASIAIALYFNRDCLIDCEEYLTSLLGKVSKFQEEEPVRKVIKENAAEIRRNAFLAKVKSVNECVNSKEYDFQTFDCLDPEVSWTDYKSERAVNRAYRALAKYVHPDVAKSGNNMMRLAQGRDELLADIASQ